MTKSEQVLQEWTNLKQKLTNSWKDGQVLSFRPMVKPLAASEELKNYARQIKNHQEWIREFERERIEFTKLESKLDQIKSLIEDNQIEKLKSLCKKGKI